MNSSKSTTHLLLTLFALLISIFFISLAFSMRPAGDDLGMYNILKSKGFYNSLLYNYTFFNFRHLPIILFNLVFSITSIEKAYFFVLPLIHLLFVTCFVLVLSKCINYLGLNLFQARLNKLQSTILSIIFLGNLYFFTFQSIEIWTDFIIMVCYLYPVIALVVGLTFLFDSSPNYNKLKNVAISLCFIYAGSGVENFSFGLLILIFGILINRYRKKINNSIHTFLHDSLNQKIIIAFISLLVSALFVYLAPGTNNRALVVKEFETLNKSLANQNVYQNVVNSLLDNLIQKKMFYAFGFMLSWILIGTNFQLNFNKTLFNKIVKHLFILLLIYLIITLYTSCSVFSGMISSRAWFPFNFIATILIILLSLRLGYIYSIKIKSLATLIVLPGIIIAFGWYCYIQIPRMTKYANSFDSRIQMLKSVPSRTSYLSLDPLLQPGVIAAAELTPDTSDFSNQTYILAYGIKFNVALKTKQP